ncbi:MAG: hypothetical protein A2W91_19420 [Bacteroidetes bacterium GWF2_38_335]|nr:MAG: hypothetical protein A2W91_19420 [Bacteroidetes bacterium GWF2_38_335]OFY79929.1 MAG: hypothetical protein A2281_10820 [Bacteroidetes bacterium RIFOXYA12_FULL_38_20]HBS86386.1 hypothetical protein [Bacteroidales bacterium]
MKTILLALFLALCTVFVNAQEENSTKKIETNLGFWLGTNYTILQSKMGEPTGIDFDNGFSFTLGLLADFRLGKHFSLSPKAGLAFYDADVYKVSNFEATLLGEAFPMAIEFACHFNFRSSEKENNFYFVAGPSYRKNLENNSIAFENHDFTIDFGIGMERKNQDFIFSPELKYSVGLRDINRSFQLNDLYFNTVSLILGFK